VFIVSSSNKQLIAIAGQCEKAYLRYDVLTGNRTPYFFNGPRSVVGIATGYGLDSPGSNPGGGEIFRTFRDRPWGPPSLLYNGYRLFPGVKSGRGVALIPLPLLVPWSRKGRAIPLLLLWAVRPVQSFSACTRVNFTFFVLGFNQYHSVQFYARKFF
jgi:hypothetical protein